MAKVTGSLDAPMVFRFRMGFYQRGVTLPALGLVMVNSYFRAFGARPTAVSDCSSPSDSPPPSWRWPSPSGSRPGRW